MPFDHHPGGTVATASDTFACDVGISHGRIAALGHDLGNAGQTIDATGLLVLPGGIDTAMARSLERDPQLESILANRKKDLGIAFGSGRRLGQELAFAHGIGLGRGRGPEL